MPRQLKKKLLMDNEIVDHTHKYWKVMDLHSVNTARDFIISGMKSDIEMVVTFADNHPMDDIDVEYYHVFLYEVKRSLLALSLIKKRYEIEYEKI